MLTKNAKAVTSAQAKVKTLAGSRKFRRSAAATSCSQVLTIATKLTTLAIQFPTSPNVQVSSLQITSAGYLTCTAAEKASLTALDAQFVKALSEIASKLASIQDVLKVDLIINNNNN